jgi:hypothetical protein
MVEEGEHPIDRFHRTIREFEDNNEAYDLKKLFRIAAGHIKIEFMYSYPQSIEIDLDERLVYDPERLEDKNGQLNK